MTRERRAIQPLAEQLLDNLTAEPGVQRAVIAGSIRRQAEHVGDIEIVVEPDYQTDLLGTADHHAMDAWVDGLLRWKRLKGGGPTARYYQLEMEHPLSRYFPDLPHEAKHLKLDLFVARPGNFGLILAIRTGSAEFSHGLASRANRLGMHFHAGYLCDGYEPQSWRDDGDDRPDCQNRSAIRTPEERDVFDRLRIRWVEPPERSDATAIRPL